MINNPDKKILKLIKEFNYPKSIIKRFLERYKRRTVKILKALMSPSEIYTIRTNTIKNTAENLIIKLKKIGIKAKQHKTISEAVILPIKGPDKIPILEKKVIIDKFASESVLSGSDLYVPGIQKFDKFEQGEKVTILSETQIPIAIGLAMIGYKELKEIKNFEIEVCIANSINEASNHIKNQCFCPSHQWL